MTRPDALTKQMMDAWPLPDGEPFPGETLRADGWVYRDLPKLTYEAFDMLMGIIGTENVRWLTQADYGTCRRGQCFISPAGIENMAAHARGRQ